MEMEKLPRVLVGCPTDSQKEYCLERYAESVKTLSYPQYDVLMIDNSFGEKYLEKIKRFKVPAIHVRVSDNAAENVIHCANLLREKVLAEGYDYLLMLESDVIPPRDIIERFLKLNHQITAGVIFHVYGEVKDGQRVIQHRALLALRQDKKNPNLLTFFKPEQVAQADYPLEVDYTSFGCIMIHRDILKQFKFRYEPYISKTSGREDILWHDMCFSKDVGEKGHKIMVDLSAKCKHLIFPGKHITNTGFA